MEPTAGSLVLPQRGRVLVIDDEPMILTIVRRILEPLHHVEASARASDALERLRAGECYDVIFCDLMMPTMSGIDLYAAIQAVRPDLAGRVVFLTGGAFTKQAREFLASVSNQRIEKPFEAHHLRAIVSERLP